MSTVFIALQCCQCSTMQVKQKKKSSNKWNCVVCNQKQSVRQVFAQSSMAKDVRKYVQSFNMSRQFAEQRALQLQPPDSDEEEEIIPEFSTNQEKKRTDWSEYVDSDKENEIKDDSVDVFEPRVVTEMPKALFRKPKLNSYVADFDSVDGDKPIKPVFGKRKANNRTRSPGKEPSIRSGKDGMKWSDCKRIAVEKLGNNKGQLISQQGLKSTGVSKWYQYISHEEKEDEAEDGPANKPAYGKEPLKRKGGSKWNSFVTEDESELQFENEIDFDGSWNANAAFKTTINEQMVEDDIHPDFQ